MSRTDVVWRFGTIGEVSAPRTVIEVDGRLYEIDALDASFPKGPRDVLGILERWDEWESALDGAALDVDTAAALDPSVVEWLPPVVYPRKLVCVGANYRDHLEEMDDNVPDNQVPYSFLKPASTGMIGSGRTLVLPAAATWIDWEAELGVVIGRYLRNVSGPEVFDYVAGYTIVNDVSNRDLMESWQPVIGMDWVTHKGSDGFAPTGPLVTPRKFVPDPQRLGIELMVNGVVKQSASTANMIFGIQTILEHLSSFMTLEPGDVISTGTPAGVGYGREPRERLEAGDRVVIEIEGLGQPLVTPVVAAIESAAVGS